MQIKKNLLSEAMFSIVSEAPAPHSVWWFNVPLRHPGVAGTVWAGLAAFRVVDLALDVCVCVCSIMGLGTQNPRVVETGRDPWR